MKYIYLLIPIFVFSACSKDDIGPMGLKHGQEVVVLIDHRYGAIDDRPLLLPRNEQSAYSLHGFDGREPGYSYRVRAKVHIDKNEPPIQDGSYYWLDFIEVISAEKHEGVEPFEIALVQSVVPSGPVIMLVKKENEYFFSPNIQLTYQDETIEGQMEEIWQHREEIRQTYLSDGSVLDLKWRSIRATVTHDPENFGKAYLVSYIEFGE